MAQVIYSKPFFYIMFYPIIIICLLQGVQGSEEEVRPLQPDSTGPEELQRDPTERSLSQCAGFCANQPENCNTMSLWCGGCPVCRRMLSEQTEESKLTDQEDGKSRSLS